MYIDIVHERSNCKNSSRLIADMLQSASLSLCSAIKELFRRRLRAPLARACAHTHTSVFKPMHVRTSARTRARVYARARTHEYTHTRRTHSSDARCQMNYKHTVAPNVYLHVITVASPTRENQSKYLALLLATTYTFVIHRRLSQVHNSIIAITLYHRHTRWSSYLSAGRTMPCYVDVRRSLRNKSSPIVM